MTNQLNPTLAQAQVLSFFDPACCGVKYHMPTFSVAAAPPASSLGMPKAPGVVLEVEPQFENVAGLKLLKEIMDIYVYCTNSE